MLDFGGESGEKARWRREQLGLPAAVKPEMDGVSMEIIQAWGVINRQRRYGGMAGVPLPLTLTDVDSYLHSRPIQIERDIFEAALFALDDAWCERWINENQKKDKG